MAAKHLCQLVIQATSTGSGGAGGASALQGSRGQRSDGALERSDSEDVGVGEREGKEGGGRERSSSHAQQQQQQQQQQHSIICAILEVGALVFNLNTAALPLMVSDASSSSSSSLGGVAVGGATSKPPLFAALNKILQLPQLAARVAGAWCLHCVGLALPSQLTNLVTHCLAQLQDTKRQTQVGVSGYCYAVSALLGTVRSSDLGLPSAKAKEVLAMGRGFVERGMKMKDTSTEKMAQMYINGGWALIGAFISLGMICVWRGPFRWAAFVDRKAMWCRWYSEMLPLAIALYKLCAPGMVHCTTLRHVCSGYSLGASPTSFISCGHTHLYIFGGM